VEGRSVSSSRGCQGDRRQCQQDERCEGYQRKIEQDMEAEIEETFGDKGGTVAVDVTWESTARAWSAGGERLETFW